jgi:general secretion pathway protein L
MTGSESIEKISSLTSGLSSAITNVITPLWKVLSYDFSEVLLPRKCVSVSIEDSGFSLALVTKAFSRFKVSSLKRYSADVPYPEPEHFASSVSLAMSELRAGNAEVVLSIPKSWAIVKIVEFPASAKENLTNVISYEMDRITPFSEDEALFDFRIIDEIDGKIKVLLAVARYDQIQPYIDALTNKGISVSRITLNIFALQSLIGYIGRERTNLFVEIDEKKYEGALFADFKRINSFSGEFRTADDKDQIHQIADNINQIINKENAVSPPIYILFKNKGPAFKEMFKSVLNIPFKILNEIDIGISFTGAKDIISYPAIGGALEALWQKSIGFNLLVKGQKIKERKPLAVTIILLLVLASMGILYAAAPLYIENKKIEEIDRQILARKDEVKKVEALKKDIESINTDIDTINGFKRDRHMTMNILKEFTSVVPKGAWLTRLRVTDKTVEIEGYAASATDLLPKLEASAFFQKVEFASPTFRDARMNMDRFSIKMEIEEPKK